MNDEYAKLKSALEAALAAIDALLEDKPILSALGNVRMELLAALHDASTAAELVERKHFENVHNIITERDQLRFLMEEKHKIAKDLVNRHKQETCRLLAEIDEWKDASGVERDGDPDGITPDDLRARMNHLQESLIEAYGAKINSIGLVMIFLRAIKSFCQKCEHHQDKGSCKDCQFFSITGGPAKDSTSLTDEARYEDETVDT
jgi:hypothetical protein